MKKTIAHIGLIFNLILNRIIFFFEIRVDIYFTHFSNSFFAWKAKSFNQCMSFEQLLTMKSILVPG